MIYLPFPTRPDDTTGRVVRLATPRDLSYLVALQNKWRHTVGFLPTQVFTRYVDAGQIAIAEENGWPVGYVNWCGTAKGILRTIQVAVEPEMLRDKVGSSLMQIMRQFASAHELSLIRLTSRVDLQANKFWPTLGFSPTAIFKRHTQRNLPLIEWSLPLLTADAISGVSLSTPSSQLGALS